MSLKTFFSDAGWCLLGVLILLSPLAISAQQPPPDQVGQWTTLTTLPFFPVHVHLLRTGKVLIWPGDVSGDPPGVSGDDPRLWDWTNQSLTTLPQPGYDVFCAGHAFLADGRLFVAGGNISNGVGLPNASLFNPFTITWTAAPDMNAGRGYPTVTTLANGDALVVSGNMDRFRRSTNQGPARGAI
jgi:galactose oxidase